MKKIHYLFGIMLLMIAGYAVDVNAQVSNDNEDEVNKIDKRFAQDYVPGQVLFKLKDGQQANIRRAGGVMQSAGINNLDAVLKEYGVQEMEQLLPNATVNGTPRRAKAYNGEVIQEHDLSQLYKITLSEEKKSETMQLVDQLKTLDEVEFAEPNYKVYMLENTYIDGFSGGNPYAGSQWYLEDYGVTSLWNKPIINKTRPIIAILDTGVDMTHPDLSPNLWTNSGEDQGEEGYDNDNNGFKNDLHGWDFINNTGRIRDYNMHGTHVAGIAAAANNGIGIVGANPKALIMPVTVMQSDGTGDVAKIIQGINYAVDNGATILNLSLGTYGNSSALRQSLERAYQKAVIVAAAGNDGRCINSPHHPKPCYGAAPMFPAAYSFVLGVQAIDEVGKMASFSNYDDDGNTFSTVTTLQDPDGFNYELKAPGTNMLSTVPGGNYKTLNGTSMAAPLVAGSISALLMVKHYLKEDKTIHQEILWGDLLHTNNIAQAYAVTQRPAELDLIKIMYRERKELAEETEEDYSGDGEIDAGETISLYPVIRTTFGAASNIRMKLEVGDEYEDETLVDILTPDWVQFGLPLSAYAKGVSLNPMQLRVSSDVADNRHIKMKFTAICDESNTQYVGTFTLVVTNMVKFSGLIKEDHTLTADHVYLINENIGINEGVTLTIEPGTRLEFEEGMGLSSFGKLVANGTPEKPIVFTGHNGVEWAGITSHESTGKNNHDACLFTNESQTLFTLLPTEETPNSYGSSISKRVYYNPNEGNPGKSFYLSHYIQDFSSDMTNKKELLTDPNYLTSAVLQMLNDWEVYCSKYSSEYSAETPNFVSVNAYFFNWSTYENPRDTLSYCKIEGFSSYPQKYYPYMKDCRITPYPFHMIFDYIFANLEGRRNNIVGINEISSNGTMQNCLSSNLKESNIVNNFFGKNQDASVKYLPKFSQLVNNNYFNNSAIYRNSGKYYGKEYWLANASSTPNVDKSDNPSYLGTSRIDIVRPYVYEIGNGQNTYGEIDLSNMRTTPITEAHGIVWKVCVNGKDAQDEYEDLAPLGVGPQKFEVYFNRPMNKAVAPQITFGVREPWTQNAVTEDGSWNEEGTIYTAYKTISGKTKSDGINRIYVYGAEDDEFFECPYEKTRFNVMINAAGSMATGFAAEAKMGRVELTWNNDENNFEDALGFNVYRYQVDNEGNEINNVRLNQEIVDIETTEYTDYDVTPGTTYYYMYKVLSTDLQEFDASNVVTATPLTSELGDANGSGVVDVNDVITTVNYAAGMDPKPFIFEAADMNTDLQIDILDVIGIIQKILNPSAAPAMASVEAAATYTIEDGMLYVDSPVALAGVQVQINLDGKHKKEDVRVAGDLDGFEHASAWLSDNDYLFLAFNMNGKVLPAGKHALLKLDDADLSNIVLSDAQGHNVLAIAGNTTGIDAMGSKVMQQDGVFNLKGQKVAGKASDLQALPKGVYIVNGEKVVK